MAFQLGFEPLEQGEGVGGSAGKAADDAAIMQAAYLARIGLHHRLAHRNLAIAGDDDLSILADRHDGGAMPDRHGRAVMVIHDRAYGSGNQALQASM